MKLTHGYYHLIAILTVAIWGLTFIATKVLINHGLTPQEIFFYRFLIAYIGIWAISPKHLFADNLKDELWLVAGGVFGFVGVEYFFAPKMSVGGELGLGIAYVNQGESEYKTQYFDTASNSVKENTVKRHDSTTPTNGFNVRTAATGNIFLSFYF